MKLKVLVYNKTRKLAGHRFEIDADPSETVAELKEKIEEATTVPKDLQVVIFGGTVDIAQKNSTVTQLSDPETLARYHIREGYTLYCTPTICEDPTMPNL